MSIKTTGSFAQSFSSDNAYMGRPQGSVFDHRKPSGGAGDIDFNSSPGVAPQPVSFNLHLPQVESGVCATEGTSSSTEQDFTRVLRDLLEKVMQVLGQFMQQKQNGMGIACPDDGASPQGASVAEPQARQPMSASAATPKGTTLGIEAPPAIAPTSSTNSLIAANSTTKPESIGANAGVGSAAAAGSGPYSLNITNSQGHSIKIGQFDKNDKLVGELALEPGQKGTMKYEADTTGLLKQAAADGSYKADASRLEFYNGFINTSDIDGRNAAIYVADGRGFEVGDKQSIADKAPDSIISMDSAGDKTISGWYDGSTDKMRQGGDFLTKELGTRMTYQHPSDDTLDQRDNPMRHTDSMTLDVVFGKS
jgi:hypothetical protein